MKTFTFLLLAVLASPAVNQYLTGKVQEKHLLEQRQLLMKDEFVNVLYTAIADIVNQCNQPNLLKTTIAHIVLILFTKVLALVTNTILSLFKYSVIL